MSELPEQQSDDRSSMMSDIIKKAGDFMDSGSRSSFLLYYLAINHELTISIIKSSSADEAMNYVEIYWPTLSQALGHAFWAALLTIFVPLIMTALSVAKMWISIGIKGIESSTRARLIDSNNLAEINAETASKAIKGVIGVVAYINSEADYLYSEIKKARKEISLGRTSQADVILSELVSRKGNRLVVLREEVDMRLQKTSEVIKEVKRVLNLS